MSNGAKDINESWIPWPGQTVVRNFPRIDRYRYCTGPQESMRVSTQEPVQVPIVKKVARLTAVLCGVSVLSDMITTRCIRKSNGGW